MEPGSRCPAQAGNQNVEVIVAEPAWRRLVPRGGGGGCPCGACSGRSRDGRAGRRPRGAAAERTPSRPQQAHQCADLYSIPRRGNHPGAGRGAARGSRRRAPPGASSGASGGAWRAASCRARPPPGRRGPADGAWRRRGSCTGWACPTRGSAHERGRHPSRAVGSAARAAGPPPGRAIAARLDRRTGAGGGGCPGAAGRAAGTGPARAAADRQRAAAAGDDGGRRDGAAGRHRGDAVRLYPGAGDRAVPHRRALAHAGVSRAIGRRGGHDPPEGRVRLCRAAGGVLGGGDHAEAAAGGAANCRCWTCCCRCGRRGCTWRWWWTNTAASTGW